MSNARRFNSTPPRRPRLGGRRPRIAFVVDWLEDPYQSTVLSGACAAATERGVHLVALPGGVIGASHKNGLRRNGLYELISPEDFDGLILMTGTLGNQLGSDVVGQLCDRFPKERVCSVAIELPGSASVLVDNLKGMRGAVEHLVGHGYKKIAFIRGPEANAEAQERYQAYCEVLEANRIPFDEALVAPGDFRREAGKAAIELFLDQRRLAVGDIDAIMSSDDQMVIAAGLELERRGVRIPEDIALMGFDDVAEARYTNPPLASVGQPLYLQGREAMRVVLSAISNNPETHPHYLETTLRLRDSCGCIPDEGTVLSDLPHLSSRLDLEATLIRRRDLVLAETTRAARGAFGGAGRGWEIRLFNALQDESRGKAHTFHKVFHQVLAQVLDAGGDVSIGNAIISALRRQLHQCIGDDVVRLRQIETLLHDARVLTSQVIERAEAARRLKVEAWARVMSGVSARLLASFDLGRLSKILSEELPRIGISACYLSRFIGSDRESSELVAAFGPWGRLKDDEARLAFTTRELIPSKYKDRDEARNLVAEPLLFEDDYLGIVVFAAGTVDGFVFEALRELLSVALHGASLLERAEVGSNTRTAE